MHFSFKEKVVVVTGASRGIGEALVRELSKKAAWIALIARDEDRMRSVAETLPQAMVAAADVTLYDQARSAIERVKERFGRIDVLINNAGQGAYGSFENTPLATVEAIFRLNVFAAVSLTKVVLPLMRPGGMIVNVSSIAGIRSVPMMSTYCASKAALSMFSETMRLELLPKNIHVLTVMPGIIRTGFSDHSMAHGYRPDIGHLLSSTPEYCAKRIIAAAQKKKKRLLVGLDATFTGFGSRFFPSLFDWLIVKFLPNNQM